MGIIAFWFLAKFIPPLLSYYVFLLYRFFISLMIKKPLVYLDELLRSFTSLCRNNGFFFSNREGLAG